MWKMSMILSRFFGVKFPVKYWIIGIFALILTAVLSFFCLDADLSITKDLPGGRFLEIAFWMTALGASVLSYLMMEIFFRSKEARLLAPLPVLPESLFIYQMRRVFKGIGISTLPVIAFWLPHILDNPAQILCCILLWPAGMAVCATISAAIILYAGNTTAQQKQNANHTSAMVFSTAPAISLGVSLILVLLLKLLAEALLKTGFAQAAVTAACITGTGFIIALCYAYYLYKTRYYDILASFSDNDLIVLNANYAFIDDTEAKKICASNNVEKAICHAYLVQYHRRYSVNMLLIAVFAILLVLISLGMPEYLSNMVLPLFAVVPVLCLSKPWLALQSNDFKTGLLEALPVSTTTLGHSQIHACIRIILGQAVWLTLAVVLSKWINGSIGWALIQGIITFLLCIGITLGFSWLSHKTTKFLRETTYLTALLFAICALALGH